MFALIWGAVRTRRAQVLTVAVLTALAAAVAAAGPWFASASVVRAAAADVAAAPPGQRTLSVRQITDTDGDPRGRLDGFGAQVRQFLPLPAADPVGGLVLALTVNNGGSIPAAMSLAYRDDFCAHVRLEGSCPARPAEAAIGRDTAQRLGLLPGGRLSLRSSPTTEPVLLTVVAVYERADPTGAYWSNALFRAEGSGFDPAFTPLDTFTARQLWEPTLSYDLRLPETLLRGDGGELATELRAADVRMTAAGLNLVNTTGPLFAAIARDRAEIRTGVAVAMLQVLLLAWFAIGLAGRYTGRDRRGDAALLKLRGSTRGSMLRLAWGQHLVPLVLGTLVGLPLGVLLARVVAGPAGSDSALLLGAAAAVAVPVGGLLVLAVLEALVLRRPVADLLRQVGAGRADWRGGLIDLLLIAVAVAAVYQARSTASTSGLALAAPALLALAVALLLARLLGRVADRGGGAALKAGRLRLGLTAVQVSRQPGGDRVFALVVVAVAVFATAFGGWRGETTARADRSAAELGADRVLTVQATNRTALLQAVRAADPRGDRAMAVVVDTGATPPLLAVDSARLAAVARWRPDFGPLPAAAPSGPALPAITGTRLSVRLRHDGDAPTSLGVVLLSDATGAPVTVRFGPLRRGEQTLTRPIAGCAAAPGCRLLRWELTSPPLRDGSANPASTGTSVTVRGLTQQDPPAEILTPAALGDIARWRPGTSGAAIDVAAGDGVLRLTVDQNHRQYRQVGTEVYAVDSALPLPVVLAGPAPATWQFAEPVLFSFSGLAVPVRVAAAAPALPVLGRTGVLADLAAARTLSGDTGPAATYQVWLTADAGPGIVGALTAAGLQVTGDETAGTRSDRLARQAPAAVTRFSLVCGVVGLFLAAAAIGVAGAVDRRTRLVQLRALRRQGLPRPAAEVAAWAGTAVLVGAGLAGGLAAALLAGPVARVTVPSFTDGWNLLPPPPALDATGLALAGIAALVVLGLTGWLSVRPLTKRLAGR